jgi:ribosomal protein S27E
MMESVVQWIFPNGSFFFTRNMKARKRLSEKLRDYFISLDPKQRKEISDFFADLDLSKVPIPELGQVIEIAEGDFYKFLDRLERMNPNAAHDELHKFGKKLKAALTNAYNRIDKDQNQALYDKSIDHIVKDLFGVEWNSLPLSVREMFKLFNEQVYELKYLRLSSNDQDLVKIVQQMIADGNTALIDTLNTSFNYMEQVSAMAGTSFKEVKIDSMAKTNPYCYFRLECPNCKASGKNVYKDSENNVHCRKCGETFSIMTAVQDDEIKQKICEVSLSLSDMKETTKKELHDLAEKIVEVEYFEAFKEGVSKNISDSEYNISRTVEKFVHESENNLNDRINEVKEILNSLSSVETDFSKNVTKVIADMSAESKTLQNETYSLLQKNTRDLGEVKTMVTMMVDQMNNIDNLLNIMSTVKVAHFSEKIFMNAVCPHCEHASKFERKHDEDYYVCRHCGCSVHKDDICNASLKSDALDLKIESFNGNLRYNDHKTPSVYNRKIARINMSPKIANELNDVKNCIINGDSMLTQSETLIILGEVSLKPRALERILGNNRKVRVIILGNKVSLAIDKDPDVWQPHFSDGSVWNYDKNLHKLIKNSIN